jgi:hypothetical protein
VESILAIYAATLSRLSAYLTANNGFPCFFCNTEFPGRYFFRNTKRSTPDLRATPRETTEHSQGTHSSLSQESVSLEARRQF